MQFECDRAHAFFQQARSLLAREDRKAMKTAEVMASIYWGILKRIEKRCYNVFGKRVRVPRPVKLWTALTVFLGAEWQK
jgi:phytoene/squalene synthetase